MRKQRNMTSIFLCHENEVLLLYRKGSKVVNNCWIGSAGGHFEEDELNDAKSCVLRELQEELDLDESCLRKLKLRYVTLRNAAGEIRINYYFFAQIDRQFKNGLNSSEGILKWFSYDEIDLLTMPFTSEHVLKHYIKEGQFNNLTYGGVADGKTVVFTALNDFQ